MKWIYIAFINQIFIKNQKKTKIWFGFWPKNDFVILLILDDLKKILIEQINSVVKR